MIIGTIDPKCELFRVSLHVPEGVASGIAPYVSAYAGEIAEGGAEHGAWVVTDRRADGSEHLYGIVACGPDDRPTLIPRWCALTGASTWAHRGPKALKVVSGSHHHAMSGDSSLLEQNLGRVIAYSMHNLPGGALKDPDLDVVATGALAAPWNAFRAREATEPRATPSERFRGYGQSVPRCCVVCGRPIPQGKRKHATSCSTKCRRRKHSLKRKSAQ